MAERMHREFVGPTLALLASLTLACGGGEQTAAPPPPPPPPPVSVASVALSIASATLVPGGTLQLVAETRDAAGNALTGRTVAWTTSAALVATVSSSGLVTGVAPGTATITAASEGKSATATVVVRAATLIGALGGTVTSIDGNVTLVIPPGALAASTPITIDPAVTFPLDAFLVGGTAYDFGPTGTVFAQPVAVKIKYDAAKVSATSQEGIGLYRATQGKWVLVPGSTVDTVAHLLQGRTSSFSTYVARTATLQFEPYNFVLPDPYGFRYVDQAEICVGGSISLKTFRVGARLPLNAPKPSASVLASAVATASFSGSILIIEGRDVGTSVVTVNFEGQQVDLPVTVTAASPPCKPVAMALTVKVNNTDNVRLYRNNGTFTTVTDAGLSLPTLGVSSGTKVQTAFRSGSGDVSLFWDDWDGITSSNKQTIAPDPGAVLAPPGKFFGPSAFVVPQFLPNGTSELYAVPRGSNSKIKMTDMRGGVADVATSASGSVVVIDWLKFPRTGPPHLFLLPKVSLTSPPVTPSGLVQLTNDDMLTELQPDISPFEDQVAVAQMDLTFTHSQIVVASVASPTTPLVKVSPAVGFAFYPTFCGASVYYIYSLSQAGPYAVYRYDVTTKTWGPVASLAGLDARYLSIAKPPTDGRSVCPQ